MCQRISELAESFDDIPNIIIGGGTNKSLDHSNLNLKGCAVYVICFGIAEMKIDEVG
jgi:hypothetical protein